MYLGYYLYPKPVFAARVWFSGIQVKFEEQLAFSNSILGAVVKHGSTDALPVVRRNRVRIPSAVRRLSWSCYVRCRRFHPNLACHHADDAVSTAVVESRC